MRSLVVNGALALLSVAISSTAVGSVHGWVHLGKRTVTDRTDHDVIVVAREHNGLEALKLTVHKKAVEIHRVKIHFANGSTQDVRMRRVIPAGGESRVLDLAGDERIVTRVELWYDAQSLGKRAVIRLFGRR